MVALFQYFDNVRMKNSDAFSVFSSKIFDLLYEEFPIFMSLPEREIVGLVESYDELLYLDKEISNITGIVECMGILGEITQDVKEISKKKLYKLNDSRVEKVKKLQQANLLFKGTIDFLIEEGFIRFNENLYQLTAKGFAHLNKSFNQEEISDHVPLIEKLRYFSRQENFLGTVASGVTVSLISKVFGG